MLAAVLVGSTVTLASGVLPLRLVRVESASMSPTLATGDLVLLGPAGRARVGDVVTLLAPGGGNELVKRVVALAGSRVEVLDGVLVVDGAAVCDSTADLSSTDGDYGGPWDVPDGAVFVLGDARAVSVDSRDFGPVSTGTVTGVVLGRAVPSPGAPARPAC